MSLINATSLVNASLTFFNPIECDYVISQYDGWTYQNLKIMILPFMLFLKFSIILSLKMLFVLLSNFLLIVK